MMHCFISDMRCFLFVFRKSLINLISQVPFTIHNFCCGHLHWGAIRSLHEFGAVLSLASCWVMSWELLILKHHPWSINCALAHVLRSVYSPQLWYSACKTHWNQKPLSNFDSLGNSQISWVLELNDSKEA